MLTLACIAVAVVAATTGLKYLLPRLHTVVDGAPAGPPPYTERTEVDDSWLRELPAIHTNHHTAQAARRAHNNRTQQGGTP